MDAWESYIYYKNADWQSNRAFLYNQLGSLDIVQAYNDNAKKLEATLANGQNIPEDFVKNVQSVLEVRSSKKDLETSSDVEKIFNELVNFVKTDLNKTILYGNLTVGRVGGGYDTSIIKDMQSLNKVIDSFKKIKNTFDNFDSSFQENGYSDVSIVSAEGMNKTKIAYDQLDNFIKNYGGISNIDVGWDKIQKDIKTVCGSLVGDFKGGLLEFGDYIHSKALIGIEQAVGDAIIKINSASLSGTKATLILDKEFADAKLGGQRKFVNKSDNVVNLTYTENDMSITVDLGISDKSYIKSRGRGKTLADQISWQPLMTEGGLTNSSFEYYYANAYLHGISEKEQNDLDRYLAAKASAFIISGISGGDQTQAYFIRYADTLVYVPTFLRQIATNIKGSLIVKPNKALKEKDNVFIQTKASEVEDAYIRTKNTLSKLRQNVKFTGARK
jgi:hypothetical protein